MPVVTMTFTLPEENYELLCAQMGSKFRGVLCEFDDWLRSEIKYHGQDQYLPVRDKLRDLLNEHGLDLTVE